VLELEAGKPFEELVVERICAPLGMDDTRVTLTPDQRARVAPGYIQILELPYAAPPFPSSYATIPALAAAGSLRSTANDMLTYLAANMGLAETGFQEAIEATHAPRHVLNKARSIGIYWQLVRDQDSGDLIIRHTGLTGGYYSFAGFMKKRQIGVVVLSSGTASMSGPGMRILHALLE